MNRRLSKGVGAHEALRKAESSIVEQRLLAPGEAVLVAVSGGLDSMVLLQLLNEIRPKHGWRLVLAHFNHQLRGHASDADEQFVRAAAQGLGLPLKVGRADVRTWAARHGLSLEMAARHLRHRFLARTATRLHIGKIALAHHADDQIELFFLRLLRGAGPEGLAGMKWISPSPADPEVQLIRPLLGLARHSLEGFAHERHVRFRKDASNDQLHFERNRLRHELLPLLRARFQPGLDRTILRLMAILSAESDFVGQQARAARSRASASFDRLPLALQRRWLFAEALDLGISADFRLIEQWRLKPGVDVMVRPGWVVRRDPAGRLHATKLLRPRFKPGSVTIELGEGLAQGQMEFAGVELAWRVQAWEGWPGGSRKPPPGIEWFDADKVGARVRVRHWRAGDRYQPIGMPSPVRVQDLFTNLRIPRHKRRQLLVAESEGGEIFWIEGLRIGERAKIDARTSRCLAWSWERMGD